MGVGNEIGPWVVLVHQEYTFMVFIYVLFYSKILAQLYLYSILIKYRYSIFDH